MLRAPHRFRLVRAVNEVPHVIVGGISGYVFRRSPLNDRSVLHDTKTPVAHFEGFVHIMGDERHCLFHHILPFFV